MSLPSRKWLWSFFCCAILGGAVASSWSMRDAWGQKLCLECHGRPGVAKSTRGDVQTDLYVDRKVFKASSHGRFQCTECHRDAFAQHRKPTKRLTPVDCARCHVREAKVFQQSVHGQALFRRDPYAPRCHHCHGQHDILPSRNPKSHTYPMNIPSVCSACHREGAKMMKVHDISQRDAVSAYSMSIHGKGIFKRGLIVSAVCTSCHGSHLILKHQDPRSSINHDNVAKTCTKCHVNIEKVHKKVVRGALWEKRAGAIPSCIDCHPPHRVRRVFYEFDLPDETCMKCHQKKDLTMVKGGKRISLYIDKKKILDSAHAKVPCIKCHVDATRRHDPPCHKAKKVDCSMCHAGAVRAHQQSVHGVLQARGSPDAPTCTLCHGTHDIQLKTVVTSPTFPRNVPKLCGRCHREGEKAAKLYKGPEHNILKNYVQSIHGRGLIKSGLVVTAKCTDCHATHLILPFKDPRSTVNPKNVSKTCAKCHLGIYETFRTSIHSPQVTKNGKKLPSCYDCHQSHRVTRVDEDSFRQGIYNRCGKCHEQVAKTYFDTFHGKVSKLGTVKAAKCHDCHGSHNVLPVSNPKSTLSFWNIVGTCKRCHPSANRKFTGYLTHATHHNRAKYPALFYTFWFMTLLLISTLGFFGLHTLLWLPRSIREALKRRRRHRAEAQAAAAVAAGLPAEQPVYYVRFGRFERFLHILVIISFLSLAVTGMTLKFPDLGFFQNISRFLGGYEVTGLIHRIAAVITFTYFALHLWQLFMKIRRRQVSFKEMFVGENSMMPKKRDFVEFWQTMKYFVGKGPKPKYGRWTYWEKFDYFAVFWGVAIIGLSGLILWFPEQFTVIFPGWMINVATVIHSDEALLATAFIFTIHFFNTHLRPEAFPMDPVIFTGRVPLEEMKEERPREYQWLLENGKLEGRLAGPPPTWLKRLAYIGGLTFLAIGVTLVVAIVYAMVVFYT